MLVADLWLLFKSFLRRTLETFSSSCADLLTIFWRLLPNVWKTFWTSSLSSWGTRRGTSLHMISGTSCGVHVWLVRALIWSLIGSCLHNRMKNPHLRAKLAEVLEAVMPHMEPMAPGAVQPIVFQRERVFCSYRHAVHLAEALITVFVDIEFTGKTITFQS